MMTMAARETRRAAERIGEPSFAEQLQQQIEDFRIGLFDFIKQYHRKRLPTNRAASKPSGCENVPTSRAADPG